MCQTLPSRILLKIKLSYKPLLNGKTFGEHIKTYAILTVCMCVFSQNADPQWCESHVTDKNRLIDLLCDLYLCM